ncbi:mediator of RNA polymerase II transcription subunit 25-like isoform X2 [Phymastichus coffea]|uniref:mediator of RNA polymerase II transcription subunit 25-like isoform X2 n=1 Tax=Phymastichus coffea TaxID=108790 RepID=UPI00273BD2F2|nr:mediator of RNA polymerase II transcription subunit 25-like isoform X2 [Phymastichus coffea]
MIGSNEHGMAADVVFVIESTASNGAYLNDFKTNYMIPTIEYFSQGIEDREFASESSSTLYGIVIYQAADCLPSNITNAFGPFSNPQKVLHTIDKLEMIGGKGESCANIGEGLAVALQCFEDLKLRREPIPASQKHCILVCNSPPYQIGVTESSEFLNYTIDQLVALFPERNINLSILSPRRLSSLLKLFEKAGGDLQLSQTKNYAKDPRHLVLLRNYNLKESPVSPTSAPSASSATGVPGAPTGAQMTLSPHQSNDSPNPNQTPQLATQTQQPQGPSNSYRNQTPQNINSVQQQQAVNQQQQAPPMQPGRSQFNTPISAPPNYHPGAMSARPPHPRGGWMRAPFMNTGPGGGPTPAAPSSQPNNQGSALIAQLSQPPSSTIGLNVQPFSQRLDGTANPAMNANTQQAQQQMNQLRLNQIQQNAMQQQNAQQAAMGMQAQATPPQGGPQLNVSNINQQMASQVPQAVTGSQASNIQPSSVPSQMSNSQQQGNGNVERTVIWKGMLEWVEKNKAPGDGQKQTWQVPCQVSAIVKDGEPEVKADSWPMKLIMQLMPKVLIGNIGQAYLKNSKSVVFYPSACDALESLIKVMSNSFAGCVHFTTASNCNIKVLLLLFTVEKRSFIGFIPNDQQAFVDRLRKVIQQQKSSQTTINRQPGMGAGPGGAGGNVMPGNVPNAGISQSGILNNTISIGGGQVTQNVIPNNGLPQQGLGPNAGQQNQLNIQAVGLPNAGGPQNQMDPGGGGMMAQQSQMDLARQQNLMKIHQLRQNLEAAQQQEAQYKSQEQIQQSLDHAQAQEMQYKQMEQAQQAQRGMNPGMALQTPQQANAQRMMRPVMNNSVGLRHLLQQQQQQQPQYRPVLGMQQQMVGPRTQMPQRPMAPGNPQNQPFDDSYDFM